MTDTEQGYVELANTFAGIARSLSSEPTVLGTLQRVVDFAVATIEGCDVAGIFLLIGTEVTTPVYSEPLALEADTAQHEAGEGPCFDAVRGETVVYAQDLADDPRWPTFGPRAAALGLRSLLSCRLFTDGTLGALNLYARLPGAYGFIDRTKAVIFAAHAGVALGAAAALEGATVSFQGQVDLVENLRGALASREVIGQAEGILIERERITSDQAFGVLRRASQHLNVKLREIAQYVVDTGEVPSNT
jgi:GAF domain-containing protein